MNDFIGYRGFNINHENKLRSLLAYHYVWESKTAIAECKAFSVTPLHNPLRVKTIKMRQEISRGHLAKDACNCGLYSVKSIKDFLKAGYTCHILGKVVSSGIVAEGKKGFRAEKMTILEFYENSFHHPGLTKQHLLELCNHYQVPLASYPEEEWNKFLPKNWEDITSQNKWVVVGPKITSPWSA